MFKHYETTSLNGQEVSFLAKPIATYNNTLIDCNELRRGIVLTSLQHEHSCPSEDDQRECGQFSILPTEVIFHIFKSMPIQSVFRLRTTSRRLKYLIESWNPFRAAMIDAKPAVMALIATQSYLRWTFPDLHNVIYTTHCEICHQHGEILSLLKMLRVCFRCVATDRRLLAISSTDAHLRGYSRVLSEPGGLPWLRTIAQKNFWGRQGTVGLVYDYTALAQLPDYDLHENEVQLLDSFSDRSNLERHLRPGSKEGLAIRRRKLRQNSTDVIGRLPSFLFHPDEADVVQFACCVHLPVLASTSHTQTQKYPMKAMLCIGCSFYYNYHSWQPHQAHRLYLHNGPQPSKPHDPSHDPPTDLIKHLQTCKYARLYWETYLYPSYLNPDPDSSNPRLLTNGGNRTIAKIKAELQTHLTCHLYSEELKQHRHFRRHTFRPSLAPFSQTENNHLFELIPLEFFELGRKLSRTPKKTSLELELERKLRDGDEYICTLLDPMNAPEFDKWTRNRLEVLRNESQDDSEDYVADSYGDVLLVNEDTVSQAAWATARVGSANCIMRGWQDLLLERKRKEEERRIRNGHPPGEIKIGGAGWGFDRFGCISNLG